MRQAAEKIISRGKGAELRRKKFLRKLKLDQSIVENITHWHSRASATAMRASRKQLKRKFCLMPTN